jgi:ATP-dependent Clp protease adapter protein ClpS
VSETILELVGQDSVVGERWAVLIHNNDFTPLTEVVRALMEATGCEVREALDETLEAHHSGKAQVHVAPRQTCREIAAMINLSGVKTTIEPATTP